MIRHLFPLALALGSLLGGCASMTAQVDVLRPDVVTDAVLRLDASALARGDTTQRTSFLEAQKRLFIDYRARCFDVAIEAESAKGASVSGLRGSRNNQPLIDQVLTGFSEIEGDLRRSDSEAARTIQADLKGRSAQDAELLSPVVRAALMARQAAYAEVVDKLYDEGRNSCAGFLVGHGVTMPSPSLAVVREEARTLANASARRVITGDGVLLLGRAEAWAVVSGGDDVWAERYNLAGVTAVGGGSDIAIVMNSTGDYSVKGFTFDARSTAVMVQKVTGLALRIAAQGAGAPTVGAAPATTVNVPVAASRDTIDVANTTTAAYRGALFRLAETLIAQSTGLAAGNDASEAVVAGVLSHLPDQDEPDPAAGDGT